MVISIVKLTRIKVFNEMFSTENEIPISLETLLNSTSVMIFTGASKKARKKRFVARENSSEFNPKNRERFRGK